MLTYVSSLGDHLTDNLGDGVAGGGTAFPTVSNDLHIGQQLVQVACMLGGGCKRSWPLLTLSFVFSLFSFFPLMFFLFFNMHALVL